jgi:hypothetical protein
MPGRGFPVRARRVTTHERPGLQVEFVTLSSKRTHVRYLLYVIRELDRVLPLLSRVELV